MRKRYNIAKKSVELQTREDDFKIESSVEKKIDGVGGTLLLELEQMSPDDIAPPEEKKKRTKKQKIFLALRVVLLALCASVFIYSITEIVITLITQKIAGDLYDTMAEDFFSEDLHLSGSRNILLQNYNDKPTPDISVKRTEESGPDFNVTHNDRFEKIKAKLNSLSLDNPDTYGWIMVEGTTINYAIVQAEDNDYYLNRSFQKKYLPYGSIFADFICSKNILENYNTVLYGHNVTSNGTMFNGVTDFLSGNFFKKYGKIEVYTNDGIFTYQVFSIYETDYTYHYRKTDFDDKDIYLDYLNELKDNSIWQVEELELTSDDRILTLSTCTSSLFSTRRYALHAKLLSVEN